MTLAMTSPVESSLEVCEMQNLDKHFLLSLDINDMDGVPAAVPASDASSSVETDCSSPCTSHSKSLRTKNLSLDSINVRAEEGAAWLEQSEKSERHVRWGDLYVRKFPMIPGDHPDAIGGPPVTIDWKPCKEVQITIDEFEAQRKSRRSSENLRIIWVERRRLLRNLGFSDAELMEATAASRKTRFQRSRTNARAKHERMDLFKERIFRKVGRTIWPRPETVLETKY